MKDLTIVTAVLFVALGIVMMNFGSSAAQDKPTADPVVTMQTTLGDITIELNPAKAPETVKNFLWYVDNKFYEGLIFHRVIANFMIQGGGMTKDMVRKEPKPPIKNESANGLSNLRGTIAMARTSDPHSASSQFFINVKDNAGLDKGKSPDGWDTVSSEM
jgi:cyclophilin family peptidyl-prolyl cis-trans isomerase